MRNRGDDKKAKPTAADAAAASRLRRLWDLAKADKTRSIKLTQDRMATVFTEHTGVGTQGLVSQYLGGKIPLNYRAVVLFANELGCSPLEIRTDLPELSALPSRQATQEQDWADIVAVKQSAALGDGAEVDEYAETHKLKFRASSLARKRLKPEKLAVIYGKGDSMFPTIKDGDAILIDTSDREPKDDKLFVVTYGRDLLAKRLVNLGGRWFIDSDNKSDPKWKRPHAVDETKGFEIHGRVRWIGSWED